MNAILKTPDLSLSDEDIEQRLYSGNTEPTSKDIAIALFHWSQYSYSSHQDLCSDTTILKEAFDQVRGNYSAGDSVIYRGVHSVSQRDVEELLTTGFVQLEQRLDHLVYSTGLESWSRSINTAKRFAIRGKKFGIILKKKMSDLPIAWEVKALSNRLPEKIKTEYYDLQDLEQEVVASTNTTKISLDDVYFLGKTSE